MSNDTRPSIAWVGTGVMGAPMAGHLLTGGHAVHVCTRTRSRAASLVETGAVWHDTPASAAARADVLCTMVGHPSDVREVVLGPQGVLAGARTGSLLVDFTSSEPALAEEIAEAAAARGVDALDAPVSGGDVGARDATLVLMVGGGDAAFARARPLFELLGRRADHAGPAGAGQHTKLTNQIAIAGGMIGICEALLYATRAGLDVAATLETIGGGAAGSWALTNLAPRAVRGDFAPGFKVDHFVKDLGLALAEARRMTLPLPGLALAEQLYLACQAQGHGQDGTQALVLALADLAAVSL